MYLNAQVVEVSNINVENIAKDMKSSVNKDEYVIQKIEESNDKYEISVYYPLTKYDKLNSSIKYFIDNYINEFKGIFQNSDVNNIKTKYFLNIEFNMYKYARYVSYVFYISEYTGGAHPNSYFYTINFDKNENKIITIDDLDKQNKSLIVDLSNYTYNYLLKDQSIKDIGALDMLKSGTSPLKENFKNFAFSDKGLMIFFSRYQVAPYVAGEFVVSVPYDNLDIKL